MRAHKIFLLFLFLPAFVLASGMLVSAASAQSMLEYSAMQSQVSGGMQSVASQVTRQAAGEVAQGMQKVMGQVPGAQSAQPVEYGQVSAGPQAAQQAVQSAQPAPQLQLPADEETETSSGGFMEYFERVSPRMLGAMVFLFFLLGYLIRKGMSA